MFLHELFVACYEGDSTPDGLNVNVGDQGGDGGSGDGGDGKGGDAGKGGNRAFTQEDLNRFLAEDRRKHKEKIESLERSYQELLANKSLDAEERTRLEASLEDLRKQYRTKEERLAQEKKQVEEKWQKQYEDERKKASLWENRYTESTIQQALQAAAIKHDAYNPQQVIVQLRSQTKLTEKLDMNGKPTGMLVPMVEMTVKNSDTGASETLQMTPDEAVEHMKKNPGEWGNFFKNNVRDGIGSSSATGAMTGDGTVDHTRLTDEQWFKLRKENPAALGLKNRQ